MHIRRIASRCGLRIWLVLAAAAALPLPVLAQPAQSPATLTYWVENGAVPADGIQVQRLNRSFSETSELDLTDTGTLTGLAVSGYAEFNGPASSIRLILVDTESVEHLVFDTYPLVSAGSAFAFEDACRETCVTPGLTPRLLRIELIDASLRIERIHRAGARPAPSLRTLSAAAGPTAEQIRSLQNAEIIDRLNERIRNDGLRWIAGETSVSTLSYADKKRLLCAGGEPTLPNFQGFDFYRGGIFEQVPPVVRQAGTAETFAAATATVDAFDWRGRHGANDPQSPYYDGDPAGSGWITSVKGQRCANCWAHCAVGAVEAQANLYFNRHLDLDLSEQHVVSCANAGTCASGGSPSGALRFIRDEGVVDERCFLESGTDESCTNVCPIPEQRIRISNYHIVSPRDDETLRRDLIDFGPITFGIASWWHCMLLVGYQTDIDSSTIWIVKNSWGPSWGQDGYAYLKVPEYDRYLLYAPETPVFSDIQPIDTDCHDRDGDGYANWGTGPVRPLNCPGSHPEKDCDDWNAALGPFQADGSCAAIAPVTTDFEASAVHCPGDIDGGGIPHLVHVKSADRVEVKDLNGARLIRFALSEVDEVADSELMPDINGNGAPEIVVLGGTPATAEVRDLLTGEKLASVAFTNHLDPIDLELVDDLTGNGVPELASLWADPLRVEVRDALTGTLVSAVTFTYDVTGKDLAVYPDLDGNGSPELAVLAENRRQGLADKIEIRDASTGARVKEIPLGGRRTVLKQVRIADINGNGSEEVAVLGVQPDGTVNVQIRDLATTDRLHFLTLPLRNPVEALLAIPDLNRNGTSELVILGQPTDGSRKVEIIRDSLSGARLREVWLHPHSPRQGVAGCGDLNGNGSADLALVRQRRDERETRVIIRDSDTGRPLGRVEF